MYKNLILCAILCFISKILTTEIKQPTILLSFLARNKAHTLPYFLTYLEKLNYPKNRIGLWIRSDHNIDQTIDILQIWIDNVKDKYHSISTSFSNDENNFYDQLSLTHWSELRFNHVINLRETALNYARNIWADYFLTIDCDVFLINPNTINDLINKNYIVIAPMLKSIDLYSNFWYGMTDDYYYQRTADYKPVLNREKIGCFDVPMIHSCVLIDLRKIRSDLLTYIPEKIIGFNGPKDDIITFAISATTNNINLYLCNENNYGYVLPPPEQNDNLDSDYEQLINLKLEILTEDQPIYFNPIFKQFMSVPVKDTLGFDKIYMINLIRRPERRERMMNYFDELGLEVSIFNGVDGRDIDKTILNSISFLPEYSDPYHHRSMTLGEIGCFLSHYFLWKKIVENNYEVTLILEDDIRFEPFFRKKVENLMAEVRRIVGWDLVYFGRKRLEENEESWVKGSTQLVEAGYSYWTIGYALSLQGAKKLLDAEPLKYLVPVDEYLPILFDKHPQSTWKNYFPVRNLLALSAAPLLIYPTHYTGEKGYISDTEDSVVAKDYVREDL